MKDVYWELLTKDGQTRIEIPPAAVDEVRKRWTAGQPIHTSSHGSIDAHQIKYFRPTTKVYGQTGLLEDASVAFNEPLFNDDGSVVCRWVKKEVTQGEFANYYSKLPAYHKIAAEGNFVTIAFNEPAHQINVLITPYCTEDEIRKLTIK